jgi:hypothetical protein
MMMIQIHQQSRFLIGRHKKETEAELSGYDNANEAESSGKDDDDIKGVGEALVLQEISVAM